MTSTNSRFKIAPQVAWQVIDGQAVVLDLGNGQVVGLNATGSLIWTMLEAHDESAIVAALVDAFDVTAEIALFDVREFVASCLDRSLLVPSDNGDDR